MLVLHPTSQCDVCLEPYTSDSSEFSPHAIPCGHIFCRNCLGTFDPANCPLCRKPFLAERIKKLHVDKPEPDEIRQNDYLHRLINAWDGEEADLVVLLDSIRTWVEPEDDDVAPILRKAVLIFTKFKKLKAKRMDDHRIMKRLHNRIADDDRDRATESEEFKSVETNLLSQIEKLESSVYMHKDEINRLNAALRINASGSEFLILQNKVAQYEAELEQLRPLVKIHESEIRRLRQDLQYFTSAPSSLQSNPLPQPPALVSYDHLPALAQALASNGRHTSIQGSPYTNGHTSNPSPDSQPIPKKNKGKEREPGPSYNLSTSSSSSSDSTAIVSNKRKTSASPPNGIEVLRGASPRRRVVPTSTSKFPLPDVPRTVDPKLVSGARPDQPVPPTPAIPTHTSLGQGSFDYSRDSSVDPARDFLDPYTLAAAYITEYGAGYGAGYRLAEYTPGEAARVIAPQPVAAASAGAVAFVNGHMNGERREGESRVGLENMDVLRMTLPDTSAAPSVRSNQTTRDDDPRGYRIYSSASVTTEDSGSLSYTTPGDASINGDTRRVPRDMPSNASFTSSTQTAGVLTDVTLSSSSSGVSSITGDSLSSRGRSLGQQPTRGQTDTTQNGLGLGLPSTLNGTVTPDSRPRTSHRNSLPALPVQPVPVRAAAASHATTIMVAATEVQPVPQETAAQSSDNHSVRTASSWGTIYTHTQPLMDWQSERSSLNIPGLRGFGQNAGMPESGLQGLEDWGPAIPASMIGSHRTGDTDAGNRLGRSTRENGAFPVMRESDEERTPLSRSTRTLASVSSAGATNGSGARPPLDVPGVSTSQESSGHREHERERRRDRNRERSSDRSRRQSHSRPLVPGHTGEGAMYAQMTTVSGHTIGQPRSHQRNLSSQYTGAPQLGQLWFESNPVAQPPPPSSRYVQPHNTQTPSRTIQPQSQSHSRRANRRLSVSTAPNPIDPQNTGPLTTAHSATPPHATVWSEAGYHTDGPSSHLHNYSIYSNARSSNHGDGTPNTHDRDQNLLTSPTLFSSNSATNALGLDGLNSPPLQITAPTPIVPSRGFLRSFSYDNFS